MKSYLVTLQISPTLFCLKGSTCVDFTQRIVNCLHFRIRHMAPYNTALRQNDHEATYRAQATASLNEAVAASAAFFGKLL